jgi:hypothetical protein
MGWNPQNLGDCDTVYARSRMAPQSVSVQVVIRPYAMTRPAFGSIGEPRAGFVHLCGRRIDPTGRWQGSAKPMLDGQRLMGS